MSAILKNISTHFIGNKALDQNLMTSSESVQADDVVAEMITTAFLERFEKTFEQYCFTHNTSLEFNEVYNFSKDVFEGDKKLHESSVSIAEHLFEYTNHPKIKEGELHVCEFENCSFEGAFVDAIGIFKTESKSEYLEMKPDDSNYDFYRKEGIDLKKIEKGCIIYNSNKEEGYVVYIFDNQSRSSEATYWKEDFLHLKVVANEFHQTNEFLGITKQFIAKQIDEEFEISKTDKIDLLNKSVDYFKTHEEFTKEEFEAEVFGNEDLIESFGKFDSNYRDKNELDELEGFEISTQAVKKQEKAFKSVLKLDKNFHIYIHGNREMIQQGIDDDGRKFYKVYYDKEK